MNPQVISSIGATILLRREPGEGHKRGWPPCGIETLQEWRLTLIKMDENVKLQGLLES